ncbi:MICOS complex subunit MIC25 isoform X3 [Octodon degus]|uniref:MICOS complex subunit MIC25 isoform X3 n=1 Tax=Octodon degus TaxID=10160 RepID=A0A6P6DQ16_OCTDE|nr:MICOS complex subunit MIC25 isoform X3 [Octodon degus]XP_023562148.1 MICOS complex subunit MIC25 isoform X3 [Octodon degus]
MGSTESCEGRRVSFGMDEEERVRVLQGIRLSENVVHRMKDPNPSTGGQHPAPLPATLDQDCTAPQKEPKLQRSETIGGRQPSGVKEDLKRFRQEQATVQDELFQVVKREREAAARHLTAAPPVVEGSADQEKQQSAWLARELESREAELRRHDTFYQEQLGHIERKFRNLQWKAEQVEVLSAAASPLTTRNIFGCVCTDPAGWSPCAQGYRPRSFAATVTMRTRCYCARTW